MKDSQPLTGLEIAVVGMSGMFPGSPNCSELWKNLKEGKNLMTEFNDEELLRRGVPRSMVENPDYVKKTGVLKGKELFDASFFGYTNEEAKVIDPQIRLFMEQCWSALEDAGCTAQIESSKIGLFAGASVNDNWRIYARTCFTEGLVDPYVSNVISTHHFISTMVSYKLNLKGPAVFIDTACSTSLVAVHLACRSLLTRDCSVALAGGATVRTLLAKGYVYQEGLAFSKDGHNRTFDSKSTGTGGGEGVGVVVLKRLNDALRDRDNIYAVIKSSSVNNDGNSKVGYGAPSVQGQIECIRAAHKLGGIDPGNITYVEAHGTATNLGDPIEVNSLNQAFNTGNSEKYCAIGSIKTNMGHLDIAAGITGLIKTALSIKHKQLPASLYFEEPNPRIDFDGGPFYVNTSLKQWARRNGNPLCAGVSAFGVGGTNAHVILEEANSMPEISDDVKEDKVLTISAKTNRSLIKYAEKLHSFLLESKEVNLRNLCYTLSVCRKHFDFRYSVPFHSKDDLLKLLDENSLRKKIVRARENKLKVVFMFSGLGSQYPNMGRELYEGNQIFRAELDKGIELAKKITGKNYLEVIYPKHSEKNAINEIINVQPVIFMFEYALARLMMEFGLEPSCMIGHSTGEYVAACLSGVFSYEDALRLVIKRGELGAKLPPGSMLACSMGESEARTYVSEKVSLAAVNGSSQTILSGDPEAISQIMLALHNKDIPAIKLNSPVAGHSYMLDPFLDEFREAFDKVPMHKPTIRLLSCVTGNFISPDEYAKPEYWVSHVRQPVLFYNGIQSVLAEYDNPLLVEIGAGNTLTNIVKKIEYSGEINVVNLVRHPKERENDADYWAGRLGLLWMYGAKVNWDMKYRSRNANKVSLPTYAFEEYEYPCEVNPIIPDFRNRSKRSIYFENWGNLISHKNRQNVPELRTFLVISASSFSSENITKGIAASGHKVVMVSGGSDFVNAGLESYTVNPNDVTHFRKVIEQCLARDIVITDVVYILSDGLVENEKEANNIAFDNLAFISILQSFVDYPELKLQRVFVLTKDLLSVTGFENEPVISSTMGAIALISTALPVNIVTVDRSKDDDKNTEDGLLKTILSTDIAGNNIVAVRGSKRWIRNYQAIEIGDLDNYEGVIKRGASYLIVGGLSKPGFVLAKHLSERYKANLTVVDGDSYDLTEIDASNIKRIRLANLKETCRDVNYIAIEPGGNSFKMIIQDLVAGANDFEGIIFIHPGAFFPEELKFGNISYKKLLVIQKETEEICELLGLLAISGNTEFLWVASSLSDYNGENGLTWKTPAEIFLASSVNKHAQKSGIWKHVLIDDTLFRDLHDKKGADFASEMTDEDYLIGLFNLSLCTESENLIIQSDTDLEYSGLGNRKSKEKPEIEVLKDIGTNKRERPDLSTPYLPAESTTEKRIKYLFENVLNIDNIGVLDNFFEVGGDSLQGMMLLKRISKEFNVDLVIKDFFQEPCIRAIATAIDKHGEMLINEAGLNNEITI